MVFELKKCLQAKQIVLHRIIKSANCNVRADRIMRGHPIAKLHSLLVDARSKSSPPDGANRNVKVILRSIEAKFKKYGREQFLFY